MCGSSPPSGSQGFGQWKRNEEWAVWEMVVSGGLGQPVRAMVSW